MIFTTKSAHLWIAWNPDFDSGLDITRNQLIPQQRSETHYIVFQICNYYFLIWILHLKQILSDPKKPRKTKFQILI